MGSQTPKQWNWLKKVLTNSIVLLIADYSALVHPDYIEVDLWSIDGLDFTSRKRRLGEKSEVEEEGAVGLEEQELESALPTPSPPLARHPPPSSMTTSEQLLLLKHSPYY